MIAEAERPALARRLLAILAADVAGYSRLIEIDEDHTHSRLRSLRVGTIDPCVVSYRGRIVKNTGDGFLAAFDSPLDAIRCAIELQQQVDGSESGVPEDLKIQFRMGINVGQTIVESDDVYGFDVNVAARLEEHAEPGGIVLSAEALDQVQPKLELDCRELGPLRLKNISRPIRAYSVLLPGSRRGSLAKPARPLHSAKIPSIAVLPFRTQGNVPDEDYFGSGIVADIIVALQSIRGLLVISRTSTLSYRQGSIDPERVGQELGVRYILSGTVRRAGEQLRITAELTDIGERSVIWADRYDGGVAELFEFQDRIATRIMWSIAPRVREAELKRSRRKRPSNMNAYDLVMHAIDLMYRMNIRDFTQAGELLQAAIRADENYAMAYAYAALWHIHNVAQGWGSEGGADASEAARLAATAVDRDPADGFALAIYGHTKSLLFRNYSAAKSLFDRALDAAPSNAMAWTLSSGVYAYTADCKAAVTRAEQGVRLAPVDTQTGFHLGFLSQAHYVCEAFDEAVIWGRKVAALNPRLCANLRTLAASLVGLGDLAEARQVGRALLDVQPRFRISTYADRCPYEPTLRSRFIDRLREADLPD